MRVSRSRGCSGRRLLIDRGGVGKGLDDNLVGMVAAAAAFEFAAHCGIGRLGISAPASRGSAEVGFANHIA